MATASCSCRSCWNAASCVPRRKPHPPAGPGLARGQTLTLIAALVLAIGIVHRADVLLYGTGGASSGPVVPRPGAPKPNGGSTRARSPTLVGRVGLEPTTDGL